MTKIIKRFKGKTGNLKRARTLSKKIKGSRVTRGTSGTGYNVVIERKNGKKRQK